MSTRPARRAGFTLIEMILAIAVIGTALVGLLKVFDVTIRRSADPVVSKQLLAIAEEMIEEIELKPYTHVDTTSSGCGRKNYDDVADYNGYTTTNRICNIDGSEIASLAGYSVTVTVVHDDIGSIGAGNAYKISVTASRGAGNALTLVAWRTGYATP